MLISSMFFYEEDQSNACFRIMDPYAFPSSVLFYQPNMFYIICILFTTGREIKHFLQKILTKQLNAIQRQSPLIKQIICISPTEGKNAS